MQQSVSPRCSGQKGESLVEVLVALAILLGILVGVLQLFTMALLSFHTTGAQTEMMQRAQTVVEVIRMVSSSGVSGTSGILPLSTGTRQLPFTTTDTGFDFWGPSGFAVIGTYSEVGGTSSDGVTKSGRRVSVSSKSCWRWGWPF